MSGWAAEEYGRELAAAREVLDVAGAPTHGKGGREFSLSERIGDVLRNHSDYISTINLNVPEPYRQPQLDLSMVRMRDAIARLEAEHQKLSVLLGYSEAAAKGTGEDLLNYTKAVIETYRQTDDKLAQARREAAARATELLEANNAEVNRRRGFEAEASQEHAEKLLLRNECIRLRDAHSVLAGFIEGLPENITAPPEVTASMDAVFPPANLDGPRARN
jgi:hypothetical protein